MIKKVLAAGAVVIATLFAAPLAANAAVGPYGTPVPPDSTVTTGVGTPIAVGVTVTGWVDGTATVVVTGPGSATITPIVTSTGTANVHSGVAAFSVTPSVVGNYSATLTQGANTASVTVVASSSLPSTGVNDPTPTIWIAGGLVAVGIALIVTFVAVRRQHAKFNTEA